MSEQNSSNLTTVTVAQPAPSNKIRRVGRVERWLSKGYGFIIDLGRLNVDANSYGWIKDEHSDSKAFVYHDALNSQSQQVFHRLFAHEYVEYDIDTSLQQRDGRYQAFAVSGLSGSKLLCDLNASAADEEEAGVAVAQPQPPQTHSDRRSRNPPRRQYNNNHQTAAPAQIIYYVPTTGLPGGIPNAAASSEPSYVMPSSGIPVPK